MDTNNQVIHDVPATEGNTPKTWGRRELLKALAATGGAVALSNIPNKWNKPEVGFGVLPAHAQASNLAAGVYTTNCDSDPATGGDITTGSGQGLVQNATATIALTSGSGSVENVPVTVSVIPQAPVTAGELIFTPALNTLNPSTNSGGTASFGDISIQYTGGQSQANFILSYSFSPQSGVAPDAQCGIYYVTLN